MDNSVYEPPKSNVEVFQEVKVPEEISRKIKQGWIAAIISGIFTLGVMIIAILSDSLGKFVDLWTSIDVGLIFLLAFGIYKRSKVAATLMFIYYLSSTLWLMISTGKMSGILLSIIFILIYFEAMVATFRYHFYLKSLNQ